MSSPEADFEASLEALVESYDNLPEISILGRPSMPSSEDIIQSLNELLRIVFSGYLVSVANRKTVLQKTMSSFREKFSHQAELAFEWGHELAVKSGVPVAVACGSRGREAADGIIAALPRLRAEAAADARAIFESDPATDSLDEIVYCYPGLQALSIYRIANTILKLGVPLIPRVMSEHAHSLTGIDIHPAATIGQRLAIDHGTGLVIGATAVIGDDVKLFHGVTIGASSVKRAAHPGAPQLKRHPTIGDRVTIYAHATILGGNTVVGAGSVIGGSVWLTQSCPPHSRVTTNSPPVTTLSVSAPCSNTIVRDIVEAIGNTPLIRLHRLSAETGCNILGKCEWLNPGGSVKDRAAKFMLLDAEQKGLLKPGGCIVEGTAGNTGIGLSVVGKSRGYRVVIVVPSSQSEEKKNALRANGAEVIEVPPVPFANPNNYVHVAERLAAQLNKEHKNGALLMNQWDNLANRQAHIEGTGPEIWSQCGGKVDGFVSAIGTGGTISGIGQYLKSKNPDVLIALADVPGAKMHAYFTRGELDTDNAGSSITQGIGQGRVTGNVDGAIVDRSYRIQDTEIVNLIDRLVQEEGICLGSSSGVNLAGAVRLAKEMGPGHTIVTILCDHGTRYGELYTAEYRKAKNLPLPAWIANKSTIVPPLVDTK